MFLHRKVVKSLLSFSAHNMDFDKWYFMFPINILRIVFRFMSTSFGKKSPPALSVEIIATVTELTSVRKAK